MFSSSSLYHCMGVELDDQTLGTRRPRFCPILPPLDCVCEQVIWFLWASVWRIAMPFLGLSWEEIWYLAGSVFEIKELHFLGRYDYLYYSGWAAITKYTEWVVLRKEKFIFSVLETGIPNQGASMVSFWWDSPLWFWVPSSQCVLTRPPLRAYEWERKRG